MERHRLFELARRQGAFDPKAKSILHFAPEPAICRILQTAGPKSHQTADIEPGLADLTLNIEDIDLPEKSFDMVICSHVLEHVDDRRALPELFRILRPGGTLIAMVPIIEGWRETYEDASIVDARERELHFGQFSHVRFYGQDFRDRVRNAGFLLSEFTASGADCVKYCLIRGETVFRADRPAGT